MRGYDIISHSKKIAFSKRWLSHEVLNWSIGWILWRNRVTPVLLSKWLQIRENDIVWRKTNFFTWPLQSCDNKITNVLTFQVLPFLAVNVLMKSLVSLSNPNHYVIQHDHNTLPGNFWIVRKNSMMNKLKVKKLKTRFSDFFSGE